jgi:antitoxin (DNA-binding transcriptional repressor) of toxin-antitoxin stability system
MTAPLSQSALRRYAQEARTQGVVVTITATDGTVVQIAPMDAQGDTTNADGIKWGKK